MDFSNYACKKWLTQYTWAASALAIVTLLLVPVIFKLNGKPHADWQQFLGRFHVLAVHLPIGMILLIPLLEIGGRFRPELREAAVLVLSLSIFACIATFTLGYLLAYGSGNSCGSEKLAAIDSAAGRLIVGFRHGELLVIPCFVEACASDCAGVL